MTTGLWYARVAEIYEINELRTNWQRGCDSEF